MASTRVSRREKVFRLWGGHCYICGEKITDDNWNVDHYKPVSKGGGNIISNKRPAHIRCNGTKGDKYPYYCHFCELDDCECWGAPLGLS